MSRCAGPRIFADGLPETSILQGVFTGRMVRDTAAQVVIETEPLTGTREAIQRERVESATLSAVSPMPEGLLNTFRREEILDLLAYLKSGGVAERSGTTH